MKSSGRAIAIQKQKENRGKVLNYISNLSAQADKIFVLAYIVQCVMVSKVCSSLISHTP